MSVRVAVIGAGVMGGDHARIMADDLPGATLQVVCDPAKERARAVGEANGASDITTDALATINRRDVDAILIASPDETHADYTIAAIDAGKPVLCEKPLAPTSRDCLRVVDAEAKRGQQLVHTGFMRRFDPSYGEMKSALDAGTLGRPVLMHNFHRNLEAPEWFTGQMAISNSAPHEFDIARFVLGAEYTAITAFQGASTATIAPVVMVLETAGGQIVTVEVNNNAGYGYDVRGELVGENGSVDLGTPIHARYNLALQSATGFAEDWRPRFAEAYRQQDRAWIRGVTAGVPDTRLADAWDGYAATLAAEAGVTSLQTGTRARIETADMPGLHASRRRNNKWEEAAE